MTKVIVTYNYPNHQSQNFLFQWFVFILLFNVINHGLKPPPHLLTIYTIVKTLIVHEMFIFPEHLMRLPRTHGLNPGTPDLTPRVLSLTPETLGLTHSSSRCSCLSFGTFAVVPITSNRIKRSATYIAFHIFLCPRH
jgi:hypothetical protein